ncbi:hypothetical protein NDU88_007204 [Pleurodeles waltl]|uniref:Murine leukemia virus integrase C-terminal domain-containing protein n=1 Tax=Pleurodeles waltl TaxID=8319 RepID=A0AAV7N1G2_PLEWA|nr:hypothetical protein NDU88_007204 [Pleurodeles waltl]
METLHGIKLFPAITKDNEKEGKKATRKNNRSPFKSREARKSSTVKEESDDDEFIKQLLRNRPPPYTAHESGPSTSADPTALAQTKSDDEDDQTPEIEGESLNEEYPLIEFFPMFTVKGLHPDLQGTVKDKVGFDRERSRLYSVRLRKGLAYVVRSFPQQVEATTLPPIHDPGYNLRAGDWVVARKHVRKTCLEPRWKGPFQVVLTTTTTMKCAGIPHWIDASHTKKVAFPLEHEEEELLREPTTVKQVSGPEREQSGTETKSMSVEDGSVTPVRDKGEDLQEGYGESISIEAAGEPSQMRAFPE